MSIKKYKKYKMNKYNISTLSLKMTENVQQKFGSLQLIIGPMYAGKSTELIRMIHRFKCLDKKVIVINHVYNNRYGSSSLTTHNRDVFDECVVLDSLHKLEEGENREYFEKADVIVIEELQFFADAYDCITKWIDFDGKCVVGAGLDGDARKQPFGDVLRLIPHAEDVIKLKALCKSCGDGTEAIFSKRIVKNEETVLVGSDDVYEAVCRKHFYEMK
jgi:thymidine kinase